MMVENTVLLYKSAQTLSTQKMWPQTEYPLTRVEECQTLALFVESLSEGLLHHPSLLSRPSPLLYNVSLPVPRPVLVVSLLV